MTTAQAIEKLKKVTNLNDFQELFFDEGYEPLFTLEYKIDEVSFSSNPASKIFDGKGSCTNSYMKFEDGYLPYPF